MKLKMYFLVVFLVTGTMCYGQYTDLEKYKTFNRIEKQLIKTRVAFDTPDSSVYVHVMEADHRIIPKEDRYYYWYKAGQIRKTRGGIEGKVLHGNYTCFYFNKNLKEKGGFTKGLRSGQWLTWYPNGELKASVSWSKGRLSGRFTTWNESGALVASGNYVNDKKEGKWNYYSASGEVSVKKFKKGVELAPKTKKGVIDFTKLFKNKSKKDTVSTKQVVVKPKVKSMEKDTSKVKPFNFLNKKNAPRKPTNPQ